MSLTPYHPSPPTHELLAARVEGNTDETRVRGLEATLRRRDAVLAAVCYAASHFLATADWERDVQELLSRLGEAAEVHHVYLFEGYRSSTGQLRRRLRNEWAAPGRIACACEADQRDVEIESVGLGRWALLQQGQILHGSVKSLPDHERSYFERMNVRTFAAVPVFVGVEWWGYLGLADELFERDWSHSVLEALHAAAATLGAAIFRMQAQEQLLQSEERFRRLTEAAFEGVVIHENGVMLEANPAFGRIFGYDVQELVGRDLFELIPTEEARALVRAHMLAASLESYEVVGRRKDGSPLIAELTARPFSYRGRPARVATINDVTARRTSEAELRRRESQLAEAQQIAHMGSWDWDIETNRITGSDEIYRIFGLPSDFTLSESTILSRVHPDDAPLVRDAIDGAVLHGRSFDIEHRLLRQSDGELRFVRSMGHVVTGADGATARIIGAAHDITDRMEAQAVARRLEEERGARVAAERAQQRAGLLAEASRVLGASFDYQTTLSTLTRLVVPAMADFCTVDLVGRDGIVERVAVSHMDPEKEPVLWEISRWVKAGAPMTPTLHRALVDGEPTLVADLDEAALSAIEIDAEHGVLIRRIQPRSAVTVPLTVAGKIVGCLAMYASESGRHFDAEDLALVQELASRAALSVENARLFHEAQLATRARDQMLGIVAHDLRNPLGTILMASELLEETLDPALPQHRQVAMMRRAGKQMNRLIQDLLDVKRLENDRLTVEPRQTAAIALLADAAEMLRGLAAASGLELVLDASDDLPAVAADAVRVQQVLSNIVGNAIKFTPRGGRITLRAARIDSEVRIAVVDTGPGIPAEQLSHVFGQYWQGSRTDRRGIGLGLAIAKGIVEAHRGRIWVESTVGEGSSFYFTLPLCAER